MLRIFVECGEVDVVIGRVVEDSDRTDVDSPCVGVVRLGGSADEPIRPDGNGMAGRIFDPLPDREEMLITPPA